MKEYIQTSSNLMTQNRIFNIPVIFKDQYPDYLNFRNIKKIVEENTFPSYFKFIEKIVIGNFKDQIDNFGIKAFFTQGIIFLSNHEDDSYQVEEERIARDIVHEASHSFVPYISQELLEPEFLIKKRTVLSELEVMEGYEIPEYFYEITDYNKTFDEFLYNIVGYKLLGKYTYGLFVTPYSLTSLEEYFTEGVEEYVFGDYDYIRRINPDLYTLIFDLFEELSK